jgi:hypothetical protein
MISGSSALAFNKTHELVNNTFSYNFASQGVAFTLMKLDGQEVYIAGNTYNQMYAELEAPLVLWI